MGFLGTTMNEEKPVLLRTLSTNSNTSSAFSQELNEFIKTENNMTIDMSCLSSSSDDGAVSTDISATGKSPDVENYAGRSEFSISLPDDIQRDIENVATKANCTYSEILDKIFIKMNVECLFTFKVNRLTSGLKVRLLPLFESSQYLQSPVVRCPYHQKEDHLTHEKHIVR